MKKRTFKKIIGLLLSMVMLIIPCSNTAMALDEQISTTAEAESRSTTPTLYNGIYCLKNPTTSKYIDIDNNASSYNGAILEQFDFENNDSQKWRITTNIVDGGIYYCVIQNLESGLYMTADGDDVILSSLTYSSNMVISEQLWAIEATSNSRYKIFPKSEEGNGIVLCVNSSLLNTNGVNIVLSDYVNNSSYKDEWYLEKVPELKLISYYDQAYDDYYSDNTSSAVLPATDILIMQLGYSCAKDVLERVFMIKFANGGISKITSSADTHTGTCSNSCSANCIEHHKNIVRLSNDIYYSEREANTIYISWTQRSNELCEEVNGVHTLIDRDGGYVLGCVVNHRPVIGMYNCDFSPAAGVCSSLTLLHELGHVFGLEEKYETDSSHQSGNYNCVMMTYVAEEAQNFFDKIYIDEKGSPFCDDCSEELEEYIKNFEISIK